MIYLDNSATTYPKPPAVRQAMARAMAELGANPGRGGFAMSVNTGRVVYECRRTAAACFGAAPTFLYLQKLNTSREIKPLTVALALTIINDSLS